MSAIKNLIEDVLVLLENGYSIEEISNTLKCPTDFVYDVAYMRLS